jgi:hypothetical protein
MYVNRANIKMPSDGVGSFCLKSILSRIYDFKQEQLSLSLAIFNYGLIDFRLVEMLSKTLA